MNSLGIVFVILAIAFYLPTNSYGRKQNESFTSIDELLRERSNRHHSNNKNKLYPNHLYHHHPKHKPLSTFTFKPNQKQPQGETSVVTSSSKGQQNVDQENVRLSSIKYTKPVPSTTKKTPSAKFTGSEKQNNVVKIKQNLQKVLARFTTPPANTNEIVTPGNGNQEHRNKLSKVQIEILRRVLASFATTHPPPVNQLPPRKHLINPLVKNSKTKPKVEDNVDASDNADNKEEEDIDDDGDEEDDEEEEESVTRHSKHKHVTTTALSTSPLVVGVTDIQIVPYKPVKQSVFTDSTLWMGIGAGVLMSLVLLILCCCVYQSTRQYCKKNVDLNNVSFLRKTDSEAPLHVSLARNNNSKLKGQQYIVSILEDKKDKDEWSSEEEVFNVSEIKGNISSPSIKKTSTPIGTPVKQKSTKLQ